MKKIRIFLLAAFLLLTACANEKQQTSEPVDTKIGEDVIAAQETPSPAPARTGAESFEGFYTDGKGNTAVIQWYGDDCMLSAYLDGAVFVEDAAGMSNGDGLVFHTVDDAENSMTLSLYRDGETYTLRVEESTRAALPAGTAFEGFVRTTEEPSPLDGASDGGIDPSEAEERPNGHYVFQPKVCSVYLEEIFGREMCDAWFSLVDAVLAGKDTFACPDQHTYDWVMGQFPERCLPILPELIDYAYDREHSVADGVARFTYLVPPEEAAEKIAAFGAQIEGILNEALGDGDSDFEKVLRLYIYFCEHYTYDYETFERMYREYVPDVTALRFFRTGTGVCQQISFAYSYLLMQAGVDAATVSGGGHQWSCVRINGRDYHVDPTFVICEPYALSYVMMTDEQRKTTGYAKEDFVFASNYSVDHPHPDYAADDDHFRPLWETTFESLSRETRTVVCAIGEDENGERRCLEFDYTGY